MADDQQATLDAVAKKAEKIKIDNGEPETKSKKTKAESGDGFYLKAYSPYKVYFEGTVESVTAENLTGTFDILKGHKNFLTLLTPFEMIVRTKENEEQIKINRGVMHVKADEVIIFLDV